MEPASIAAPTAEGRCIERRFTVGVEDVWATVKWSRRDARAGEFFQANVEAPADWGDQAVAIVAKLYFATVDGVKEESVKQLIGRVADKITLEARMHGYFGVEADRTELEEIFRDELIYILLHQMAAFNTPVWLNFGVPGRKQVASACFLLSISDTMIGENGITEWWGKEAKIFKGGAGSGINVSNLRGSMEQLSTGGVASGPCAYMRTADSGAGTLKSGGAHRRAAKMVCLDVDHPDVQKFISLKPREDQRMRALAAAGFELDPSTPEGEELIAECTSAQNANLSVRVSNDFMRAVENDDDWNLTARKTGEAIATVKARVLFREIAEAAWQCGDPGLLFHDTINLWHTTPEKGPITTCNPCAETHLNDDSSCNLASLNLLKFIGRSGDFDVDAYCHVIDVMTTAMDVTCSFSELPTETIEKNTRNLRQLGLGYANLGAALMVKGLPYDSEEGRDFAGSVTALLTGRAYQRSAELAEQMGPFAEWENNRDPMMEVMHRHDAALDRSGRAIWKAARECWHEAIRKGEIHGYRNAQASVIAPTGTTSFMMGCDTTGGEPAIALVSYKKLASAGTVKMVNGSVERALKNLHYSKTQIENTLTSLRLHGILSGVREEHMPVFATAVGETNTILAEGHVRMLAAIQPFISGATSKTVNVPEATTVEEIEEIYRLTHTLGVKAVAIFREGSKVTSVLSTKEAPAQLTAVTDDQVEEPMDYTPIGSRKRLPAERRSITHKFSIDGYEGYITAGMYEDGSLGEIFLTDIGKEGSTLRGMMGAWATAVSIALQHGVPLETYARKFSHMRFEPEGVTANPEIRTARSLVDYIMRWLVSRFSDEDLCEELGVLTPAVKKRLKARLDGNSEESQGPIAASSMSTNGHRKHQPELSAPVCGECGNLMQRAGTCYTCACGNSTGCG